MILSPKSVAYNAIWTVRIIWLYFKNELHIMLSQKHAFSGIYLRRVRAGVSSHERDQQPAVLLASTTNTIHGIQLDIICLFVEMVTLSSFL